MDLPSPSAMTHKQRRQSDTIYGHSVEISDGDDPGELSDDHKKKAGAKRMLASRAPKEAGEGVLWELARVFLAPLPSSPPALSQSVQSIFPLSPISR